MFVGLLWIEADHHQDEDEGKQQEGAHYQQLERCHIILCCNIRIIRIISMISVISKNQQESGHYQQLKTVRVFKNERVRELRSETEKISPDKYNQCNQHCQHYRQDSLISKINKNSKKSDRIQFKKVID